MRIIQAAVWCVYFLYHFGSITRATTLLAQAYTLACLNRFHQIDEPGRLGEVTSNLASVEKEECRSTMWMLFILDRQVNYLIGRHFVINDHLFFVNYPLDDMSLQNELVVVCVLSLQHCWRIQIAKDVPLTNPWQW